MYKNKKIYFVIIDDKLFKEKNSFFNLLFKDFEKDWVYKINRFLYNQLKDCKELYKHFVNINFL